MADTKISALSALAFPATNDKLVIVDVSDTTMAATGTNKSTTTAAAAGLCGSSVISGLALANNGTDATNDIDIATGVASLYDGSAWHIALLTSGLTKQLDAAWSVGSAAGGLDTGTKAISTWYHVWLIQRSDTGVVDALFSTSASAPTMPANYDRKRRIGAIYNNASNAIATFVQRGDEFVWATPTKDVVAADPGTSAVLRTISTPLGIEVMAHLSHSVFDNSYSGATYCLLSCPMTTDRAAAADDNTLVVNGTGLTTLAASNSVTVLTNTSSQVRSRLHASDADRTLRIQTVGWTDSRGRN